MSHDHMRTAGHELFLNHKEFTCSLEQDWIFSFNGAGLSTKPSNPTDSFACIIKSKYICTSHQNIWSNLPLLINKCFEVVSNTKKSYIKNWFIYWLMDWILINTFFVIFFLSVISYQNKSAPLEISTFLDGL